MEPLQPPTRESRKGTESSAATVARLPMTTSMYATEAMPARAVKSMTKAAMITIPRTCSLPAAMPNVSRATASSPGKMMCRMSPPPLNWYEAMAVKAKRMAAAPRTRAQTS